MVAKYPVTMKEIPQEPFGTVVKWQKHGLNSRLDQPVLAVHKWFTLGLWMHRLCNYLKVKPTCEKLSQKPNWLFFNSGVGFKVGGDTEVNYLVLQVHYANVDKFLSKLSLKFFSI